MLSRVADILEQRQRIENLEAFAAEEQVSPTLLEFCQWYLCQRKSDCEHSTIRKITASLNQLCEYCREYETIETVEDVDAQMAFRYQLKRQETKAEATVSKDVKIAKTAFKFGVKAGKLQSNPFQELKIKANADVNPDGQHIVPVSDYESLIDVCPDSDWRTIIALARTRLLLIRFETQRLLVGIGQQSLT